MKIAKESAIRFHTWYLHDDDGGWSNGAGPRSSLCRILNLLQEEGPALIIIINLPKCEVFS